MEEYLNPQIIKDFRELINSTNIFYKLTEQKSRWNLICTLMDRIDSAIDYLNKHSKQPETEEELVFIVVFACIIKDGIYKFYENIYNEKPPTLLEKKWFSCAKVHLKPYFTEDTCPTDDVFFDYFRALTFAHPFDTSHDAQNKRLFMRKGEVHMSPWVFVHSIIRGEGLIGLRIYTNSDEENDILDLFIPYENFKKYVQERYELIKEFVSWGSKVISNKNEEWQQIKINRSAAPLEIIKQIKEVLESRFVDEYSLDDVLYILEYSSNIQQNMDAVSKVKAHILESMDEICDAVDNLDNEKLDESLSFLWNRPKNMHQHAHYELEKTFDYLEDEKGTCLPGSNEEWGLKQAEAFYFAYAHKYVFIDFKTMQYKEIKLLIRVSCILGYKEELK